MVSRGLPGLTGVDHIGITVPDLAEADRFLVDVIGCEYMYSLGPFRHDDTDWMCEHLGVDARAVMQRLHFYRCGGRAIFEVFQYASDDQVSVPPLNSDVGGHHVAFYVDDLDAAIRHLESHGVTMMGEPTVSRGPSEGQRWVYFRAPWGLQFELVSYPDGKAFDREGGMATEQYGGGVYD
jgi:catechol 2,3-dioxygenase-like lactoylglutathione lyase family enzyme